MQGSSTIRIKFKIFISICLLIINVWSPEGVVAQSENTTSTTIPIKVGVVLDMDSLVGKIGLSCMKMALLDFYATHPHFRTRLVFNTKDSIDDVVLAASTTLDLIRNEEVQAIIGPKSSMQANFMINLGNKSQVPIISFSATSPSLTSLLSPYFFRAAQSDSLQVKAISVLIEVFGWREVVPIYIDTQFGETLMPNLTAALQDINIRVPYMSVIPTAANDDQIASELYKLMNMRTRVFIVHTTMTLGSQILTKAKELGMMSEGYVWIMTDTMTTMWRSIDLSGSAIDSMQGVLGVRSYVPKSKKLENFTTIWKRKFHTDNPNVTNVQMNMFGLWAYDATFVLAMAVEKAGISNLQFDKRNSSSATELETLGVSQNGPRLIRELSNIKFEGLSGDFHFVNGELESNVFEIININGNGERRIGFWTAKSGLVKDLNSTSTSGNSTSKPKLGPVIWPGNTVSVPKGWKIPTEGKKLRIGVPVIVGFTDFLEIIWESNSNKAKSVKGYCIDVFEAVIRKMPYPVPYEYVPFATHDRKPAGSYNDLVDQVYYGNYDGVAGDVNILANRSLFVEFTLPYTESDVSMLVPIKDIKKKNAWVFLQPLTSGLWITIGCFFVFTGFVVWILEHRINEDFRGPPSHQVGTSFWFSFSTMVFAHRERVVSNLGRFVVIIWSFVVLILTQSYTASLSSLLTVEQLQPTITDINELLKNNEGVGVLDGSFVDGNLLRSGFKKTQFKIFRSPVELHDLFTNGSISAAFEVIPYLKIFLSEYCGKYTIVKTISKTNGFGFVFPKGSPLVPDISRAILNVTQGDEMNQIQDKWFKSDVPCPDFEPTVSSNSLGLESFSGLFLIAGIASISVLIIFIARFLYEQRHVLFQIHHETSIWRKVRIASTIFDQKDLSSHTFKKTESRDASNHCSTVHSVAQSSSNTNCPPSPSSSLNQTDSSEFAFIVEQGTITDSPERSSIQLPDCRYGG